MAKRATNTKNAITKKVAPMTAKDVRREQAVDRKFAKQKSKKK